MTQVKTFGAVDERSLAQLRRCLDAGEAPFGVLCADHHPGYSQPIGGGVAYREHVSPSGVGYDIGCGNKAVRTSLTRVELDDVQPLMLEIARRVSFGMGVPARERGSPDGRRRRRDDARPRTRRADASRRDRAL